MLTRKTKKVSLKQCHYTVAMFLTVQTRTNRSARGAVMADMRCDRYCMGCVCWLAVREAKPKLTLVSEALDRYRKHLRVRERVEQSDKETAQSSE